MSAAARDPLDELIERLEDDVAHHKTRLVEASRQLDALRDLLGDGTKMAERLEVRDLEDLYRFRGRSDRDRKPARPDFGGAS